MRRLLAMMIVALFVAVPGYAADAPDNTARLAVADAFDRAQLTQDRAAMERMIADDLVFIESSGKRTGKKEFIAGWMGADDHYDPITLVDRVVTVLGPDAFMVSAQTVLSGTSGGKHFASTIRYTDTFRRDAGQWHAVHIQVTRVAE